MLDSDVGRWTLPRSGLVFFWDFGDLEMTRQGYSCYLAWLGGLDAYSEVLGEPEISNRYTGPKPNKIQARIWKHTSQPETKCATALALPVFPCQTAGERRGNVGKAQVGALLSHFCPPGNYVCNLWGQKMMEQNEKNEAFAASWSHFLACKSNHLGNGESNPGLLSAHP